MPGGDEGFLRHVLGVLATGEFLAEEMKEAGLMAAHQFLKRSERATLGVAGELLFVDGWDGVCHLLFELSGLLFFRRLECQILIPPCRVDRRRVFERSASVVPAVWPRAR